MRRKSSAQNLLSSFKPVGQNTGTVSSATGIQFSQIVNATPTTREWDVQSLSLQSDTGTSIASGSTNGVPAASQASNVEILRELVKKRIITLTYLRNVHEGRSHWFHTIMITRGELDRVFNNTAMKARTYRFAILGMSLAHSFDVKEPQDLLRSLLNALNEYETSKDDGDRPKMRALFRHDVSDSSERYVLSEVYNKISKILGPSPFPATGQHMMGPLGLLSPHPGVSYLFTGADAAPTNDGDGSLWGIAHANPSTSQVYGGGLGSPPPQINATLSDAVRQVDARLKVYDRLQSTYKAGKLLPLEYRRKQLYQLARAVQENITAVEEALFADIGRPRPEAGQEGASVIASCLDAAAHLEEWAAPEKPKVAEWMSSWDASIYSVPKGVALIISPWNFPFALCLIPLVGAIAAGCPTVLKPSEHAANCAVQITRLIAEYLNPDAYVVVNGAIPEMNTLLSLKWDHIFFTGGGNIGKIVATAAAQKLTPVTLELGGKCPVIVADDCDVELAAKRILWGKSMNSGQLCVTADHVYVVRSVAPAFRDALLKVYAKFWPKPPLDPEMTWGKIINPAHHARVKGLLDRTLGTIVVGGDIEGDKKIAPTIVSNVKPGDSLMEEEIFGPVLPILEVDNVDEAIDQISNQPSPLAIYAFTSNEEIKHKLLQRTRSGAVVYNDVITQLTVKELPFGGVGESGYGRYYGKSSFDTFSHRRNFLNVQPAAEPAFAIRYRPYTEESYQRTNAVLQMKIPQV
ncbi:hypothetical protein EUX98_g2637 [Antrodiella citrinella]|uniref:Aldehyde dehydrogenase domain-containing protein n=1 Tax=Antrodiella citrinella TaxID=2447956 RepID=A0A4S4N1D6_9APHY|nr:hypothetical protein EUX98_g2637 [Antrodiella citrinella]